MDQFLPYTWYDLKCLGRVSLVKDTTYTADILVKSYDPAADCFHYKRLRNVAMRRHWRSSGNDPVTFTQADGCELPSNVRPLAFMFLPNTDVTSVCPEILDIPGWETQRAQAREALAENTPRPAMNYLEE